MGPALLRSQTSGIWWKLSQITVSGYKRDSVLLTTVDNGIYVHNAAKGRRSADCKNVQGPWTELYETLLNVGVDQEAGGGFPACQQP